MKSSDNLNKALRDALKDHPEPLHDGQWDKLYRELHEKKSKRIFPWFGFWIILLVTGLTGFLTGYLLNSELKNSNPIAVNSQDTVSPETASPNSATSNLDELKQANSNVQRSESNTNSNAIVNNSSITQETNSANSNSKQANPQTSSKSKLTYSDQHQNSSAKLSNERLPKDQNAREIQGKEQESNSNKSPDKNIDKTDLALNGNNKQETNDAQKVPAKTDLTEPNDSTIELNNNAQNDVADNGKIADNTKKDKDEDLKKKPKKKKPKLTPEGSEEQPKWVFGLSLGMSTFNTRMGAYSAPSTVHKDVKDVNENSLGDKKSNTFKLSVNYRFLKGLSLGFNTGFQYRTVREVRDFNYTLDELPFRKPDNSIDFYIPLKDTQIFLRVNESRTSEFRYVTIPFTFSYNFALGKSMELTASLGTNINYLARAKAQVLDLDKFEFSELSSHSGPKVNFGWMGSAMLSRRITGPWWIGFEFGLQRNRQKYKLEYSDFKSFNTFTNYNLCLRYKL